MADTELQDAIEKAAVEITKDLPKGHEAKVEQVEDELAAEEVEAGDEPASDEPASDDEPGSDDLSEAQLVEAKRIYRALSDPKAGPAFVAALAQQNGLLNKPIETDKQQAVVKKGIQEIFKEELGENYGFLADRLAKAVDKALDTVRDEQREQVAELQVQQLTTEVETSLTKLAKEKNLARNSKEFKTLENQIADLMDEYPMGKSGSVEKYIRDMERLASSGRIKANVERGTADKIRRNANNVADRLHRTSNSPSIDTLPGKKMGLKASVEWAAAQLAKGNK